MILVILKLTCSEDVIFAGDSPVGIICAMLLRWFIAATFTFELGVWVESIVKRKMAVIWSA